MHHLTKKHGIFKKQSDSWHHKSAFFSSATIFLSISTTEDGEPDQIQVKRRWRFFF